MQLIHIRTPDEKLRKKTEKLVAKGDKLVEKEKWRKALEYYRKAYALDPHFLGLARKIEFALNHLPDQWGPQEFVESLELTMEEQAHVFPAIRQTHARLSSNWDEVFEMVVKLFETDDEQEATAVAEQLVASGEMGTRALIDFVRSLRAAAQGEGHNPEGTA